MRFSPDRRAKILVFGDVKTFNPIQYTFVQRIDDVSNALQQC